VSELAVLASAAPTEINQDYLLQARQMQALSFAVHIPLVCFGIAFPTVRCHQRWAVAGETPRAAAAAFDDIPFVDRADEGEAAGQSELGVSVQVHPRPRGSGEDPQPQGAG
jgi:hypothetical protein